MIIKVDAEAKKLIEGLCDLALRVGMTKNLKAVNNILNNMSLVPQEKKSNDKSKRKVRK